MPASITTRSGPAAQPPCVSSSGLKRSCVGSIPQPKFGWSPLPIALPSRPISFARSVVPLTLKIAPEAASTAGSSFTFGSSDSGTVALPLAAPATTSLPEITALVPS